MAATPMSGELLGAHVSTQGGVDRAPPRGAEIGATAIQLFTKTPNQWKEPVVGPELAASFRAALAASGLRCAVSHDSYLINLASPDPALWERSLDSFTRELERCAALGLPYVVSHPGNFIDDRDAGLARNVRGIAAALERVPGAVTVCLETTAGAGTALGRSFEELARLREGLPPALQGRVAFCADTCHLYSAGYDLVGDFDRVWEAWDRLLGLDALRVLHLNDSKTPFASRRDRHELIAEGSLGEAPFRRLMTDPRFAHAVKLLETPKGDDATATDRRMLARLRGYVPPAAAPAAAPAAR
ncbi:MAG TPA: deoxyribonuclease IV [Gemmatimonadales bacterium]|nr:deoxyribonuclease IV [Gemmatimonadales bacterium]